MPKSCPFLSRAPAPISRNPRPWRRSVHLGRGFFHKRCAVQTLEQTGPAGISEPWEENKQVPQPPQPLLYDPERERDYFAQNKLIVASRMVTVAAQATRFLAAMLTEKSDSVILGVKSTGQRPAQTLQEVVTRLGPCFIKLAQTLSMRPDLIGETYAEKLSELQDSVLPFDNVDAFEILERELGRPVMEVFSSISQEPVASASLGQVYRAVLASTGAEVAVKVQRPSVESTIALDVYLLRKSIGVAQRAAGIRRDLRVVADEIGRSLFGELDFRLEAQHAKEFLKANQDLHFVSVPTVYEELTTRRVLVMEWVDGQSPAQLLAKTVRGGQSGAAARARILSMVRMGIQCSLSQLLVTGIMHGDPHSGNLLLTKEGKLCYLDFGMLVRVSSEHRQAMMCALIHMGLGEWRRLVDDLAALDLLKPDTNRRELADDLEQEFNEVLLQQQSEEQQLAGSARSQRQLPLLSLQTSSLSFGTLTAVLFRVAFKYKFLLPPYFPLLIRSLASLEGVALLADPSFKLISAGMPIVLHQLLSDRRPAAVQLLRELLLSSKGGLRTDATAQQIMQVWARARQQEVLLDVEEGLGGQVPCMLGGHSMSGPSLMQSVLSSGSISSMDLQEDDSLNLAGLLLDRDNAPLRRVLMEVNPAITVANMQPSLLQAVQQLAVDNLAPLSLSKLFSKRANGTGANRLYWKRLQIVVQAQAAKAVRSPPAAIWKLVLFTAHVAAKIALIKLGQTWTWVVECAQQRFMPANKQEGSNQSPEISYA